jgi:hypothetical protein
MAMSEDQKEKIREGVRNYYKTHDAPMKGKKMSESAKEQIRDRLKDYYTVNPGPMTGVKMSDETKEKIRQSMLRRSQTQTVGKKK